MFFPDLIEKLILLVIPVECRHTWTENSNKEEQHKHKIRVARILQHVIWHVKG